MLFQIAAAWQSCIKNSQDIWGISTVGSALHSHCRGHRFESGMLHQQRTQILIQCLSPCFCIYSVSALHYCTKQARYNPKRGVNLQAPAFCLQAEKMVHPSQSLPKSVRLLKMPFLAPICTPLSNSEHCVRVVTLLRTELIVTEYLKKYLRQNEPWAKSRLWLPVFGVFLPVRWGVRVLLGNRKQINPVHRQ